MMKKRKPKIWEALVPIVGMALIIVYSMLVLKVDPHIPIVISTILAGFMALRVGCSWSEVREGMIESIYRAVEALIIVMIVGMLIGSWVLAGSVPAMIYYGLELISPTFFLPTGCILCAIVSVATGSAWTSGGTIGVALMGIGTGLGINPALTAGMVISGAYFGDKVSPLSDSTNVAAATAETDLYLHVRSMMYTTVPSFVLALLLYFVIGLSYDTTSVNLENISLIKGALSGTFTITPWLLIPPIVVLVTAAKKVPAIPSLLLATVIGSICAVIFQGATLVAILDVLQNGYVGNTGLQIVDKLLTRGGVNGMLWTISLIIFALCFGGILEKAKFTEVILEQVIKHVHSVGSLVATTIVTGIVCDFVLTDQYLANIIPGRMYYKAYDDMGLERYYLSRTLEDGGSLWSPMFPWNGCGAYQSATLGVSSFTYFPYAFLNLINPIVSIIMAYMGIAVFRKRILKKGAELIEVENLQELDNIREKNN
ncbi:Na+/H+ antiporter NhaC [Fusobacterium necrophorum subsp. funduliforme ATCC 51357]|uniref:Na+/H+ antiporter NhaC n=3 Tax=Fusobacterium necrophorum TaxID=859 RepID=A0A162IJM5_9FUSO|nr:Na+/H+ antiporter NhaC [Fusobacterium necrophorum]KDE64501.1 sodium:proton antiporter [Fusobacterium necrophorum DJ-1]AYV93737.1 Na+/H+ antiporter NhaC [Fusobacterium necrophorum subsp. funduliforme]AYZ73795.1 Na+/H+ antiporter NhaC [Fusobacterium necrophorum]AZW08199.1 Na+/H+ antiporter NhaC [Fusobacterium necrophorum subsp. necrophorum]EIJ68678.1 Na+/H+ antiporter NhaC [Fusobacterium necrophorum subsp. funduliforme ATCC 51357]